MAVGLHAAVYGGGKDANAVGLAIACRPHKVRETQRVVASFGGMLLAQQGDALSAVEHDVVAVAPGRV